MTIVMGLDQHRAQITAEWIDTATGEISRTRIAPADRAGVRAFAGRFRGQELEVALEATTGWRFVVEELQAVGARVHLAEPAETAARRGTKKRAKSDRADARHLRELVMVGRLPESWIPPEHLLELRARVRLRHTLVDQRREWQQRMQAVLYHHGVPPRSWLLGAESRAWLAGLELPPAAREQITIALALIDAHDAQLVPLDQRAARLRQAPARLPGADAPLRDRAADLDHDPRRARRRAPLQLLARGRPLRRPGHHRPPIRRPPRPRPPLPPRPTGAALGALRGRPMRPPARLTRPRLLRRRRPRGSAATAPAWRSRASCSSAATTRCANSARRPCSPHDHRSARAALTHADAPRPAPGMLLPPPPGGRPS